MTAHGNLGPDLRVLGPALAGARRAPIGRRFGAYLIDSIPYWLMLAVESVWAPISTLTYQLLGGGAYWEPGAVFGLILFAAAVVWDILQVYWHVSRGQTFGRRMTGIRVVQVSSGQPLTFGQAVGRSVIVGASSYLRLFQELVAIVWILNGDLAYLFQSILASFLVIALVWIFNLVVALSPLWDSAKANRGWHDKAVNAVLIDVRNGRDTFVDPVPLAEVMGRPSLASTAPSAARAASAPPPPPPPPSSDQPAPLTPAAAPGPPPPPPPAAPGPPPPPPAAESHAPSPPAAPAAPAPAPAAPTPAPFSQATPSQPVASTPPSGLISEVPGVGTPAAPPAPRPSTVPVPQSAAPGPTPSFDSASEDTDPGEETVLSVSRVPVLRFDVGIDLPLQGRGVVGRNPADLGASPEPLAHLVPLEDPARSISKTHLEFGIDGTTVWVTDLHSTNGSFADDGRGERRLEPGVRTVVPVGAVVRIGNRSFRVDAT